ncbi:hypothetical protein [Acidaminococcus timonensis]|uniref:hypothetical protein n=1 Tax=Acidaminococcus TaxID=904 RepID=UPI0026EDF3CD|nr:hypothetical protein [Acidaminococcus timonensis]
MSNMVFLVVCCLVTWVIFLDSHSIGMKHKNLWVLGTFLLMPLVVPLYLIRRAQFIHAYKLTPRQKLEAKAREESRKRRQKAEKAKLEWEMAQRRKVKDNPAAAADARAREFREQHEMRLALDNELSEQQKRHEKQWGIHSKS